MSNLVKRTATGILIIVMITGAIILSSISYVTLFLLILIGTLYEFYNMLSRAKIHPQMIYGISVAVLFYVFSFLNAVGFIPTRFVVLFLPLISFVFISELVFRENRPIHNIAFTLLGLIYISVPFALLNYMAFYQTEELNIGSGNENDVVNFLFQPHFKVEYFYQILLGFFFLHWINDTGAYVIGVPFGKHKLFKRISPKKSWEGLLGGIFFAVITGFLLSKYLIKASWQRSSACAESPVI